MCSQLRQDIMKNKKLLLKILKGTSDTNINFDDLCGLMKSFGFELRIKGSHHIFRKEGIKEGIMEKTNLQRSGDKAKPYQVKQVRNIIIKYKLGGAIDV